ncbi:MAG TPA: hypothetical protein VHT25_02720 [Solirubrobacteraceae bacterium]|nr:hypothetical protein [Solirubrobacteraceae bacterium]
MARILIVGGGCRGRRLSEQLVQRGHALRVTTRSESGRAAIEAVGAECWIGTPDRLATLRGALDSVTIACWMLAAACGDGEEVAALHGSRLEFFLSQAIDTTVRGFLYDAAAVSDADVTREMLRGGEALVESLTQLNAIPSAVIGAPGAPDDARAGGDDAWVAAASDTVDCLLGG